MTTAPVIPIDDKEVLDMAGAVRLRVGELLRERNWSNSELAERAGIAPLTARMLAKGMADRIDLGTITKVCIALGVQPAELFEPLALEESSQP